MKRPLLAALVALVVGIPAMASAANTITITSPTNGASISKGNSPTTIVTGTAAFGAAVPATRVFYVRRAGCGANAGPANTRLSITQGTDSTSCGSTTAPLASTSQYPAEDGIPLTVDASKPASATITLSSFSGVTGVGTQVVTATLTGRVGNQTKTLGTGTHSMDTLGVDTYAAEFPIPLANPGGPITTLNLALTISGAAQHGFVNYGGTSFINLPILDTGSVDVSSDSSTYAASKTVKAELSADGTWVAEITTPSAGSRKIYARAVQGTTKVEAAPVSITVTA